MNSLIETQMENIEKVYESLPFGGRVEFSKSAIESIHQILGELKEYRELEESGKLIKLPYPVGTKLFIPCRKQGVKQDHIRRWQTNNKGLMFCSNGSFYLADAIGKTVFLTMEEAENKLKEMKK
jgi:hypothetical protein